MAFVLDVSTGKHYYTYPEKFNGDINLLQTEPFAPQFAVFKILDTIYNDGNAKVSVTPKINYDYIGDIVWRYRISSPVINKNIYIREYKEDSTPTRDVFDNHVYVRKYKLKVGDSYEMNISFDVMKYQLDNLILPAKDAFKQKHPNYYKTMFKQHEKQKQELIKIGNSVITK